MTVEPTVRPFSGDTALPPWYGFGAVEVAFDAHGPLSARVEMPRLIGGVPNPALLADALFPGMEGVMLEIDGRDLGTNERGDVVSVPDLWLGRATDPEGADAGSPVVTVGASGPKVDLEQESIPALSIPVSGSAGDVVRRVVNTHPNDLRMVMGDVHMGRELPVSIDADSVWGMMERAAEDATEEFTLTALQGRARWRLSWLDPLSAPDLTGGGAGPAVVLFDDGERQNARISMAYQLTRTRQDIIVAGAGWRFGGPLAVTASTGAATLGKQAALTAAVNTTVVQRLGGNAQAFMRPDLTSLPALQAAAASELRRLMRPPLPVEAEILDTGLWKYMRPRNVVATRLADEVTGLYRNVAIQIRTATFQLCPVWGCRISGEVWAV